MTINFYSTDETYRGRCIGKDGEPCVKDQTAVCWNKVCKCIEFYSDVNGKCTRGKQNLYHSLGTFLLKKCQS
jgi:hypothetical protein